MPTYEDIALAAAAYTAARAAARAGHPEGLQLVLRARLHLAACIAAAGWIPSAEIAIQIQRDADLLAQSPGSDA